MSKIIVVGTLAFDTIETPFGKVERVIGGSAPFASLAAKTKNVDCAIVSIVGNDFPKSYLQLLVSKEIDVSEVQIEKNGKSFFWSGKYHDDMNKRDTLVNMLRRIKLLPRLTAIKQLLSFPRSNPKTS